MKRITLITAITAVGTMLISCGGRTETGETEKKTPVVVNTNTATPNANTAAVKTARDADDVKSTTNSKNTNAGRSADRDDKKSANANQPVKRVDADDRGKKDDDDDDR